MDELVKIALVGTARYPGTPTLAAEGPDALLAELAAHPEQTPENLLLLRAGAAALVSQAGLAPTHITTTTAPAPADAGPRCSRRLIGLLQNALATDAKELLREFARLMKIAGLLMPPEVLPTALDIQEPALRETLLPILGNRGRWLSQFNPDWQWVGGGIGDLREADHALLRKQWAEGNIAQRAVVLRRLREADPADARRMLAEVFKVEKPEHRSRLLDQLQANLSADDEAFLEETLGDRSETVRSSAAELLARLPESQFAQRMTARGDAILAAAAGSKPGALLLECKPPTEIDAAWKRDGVSDRAAAGRGKRAAWVVAVLRAVSPAHWTERFHAGPAELIAAVRDDDFATAVIEGWTEAALAFADQPAMLAWLVPLWNDWADYSQTSQGNKATEVTQRLTRLLQALPAAQAEVCLQNLMHGRNAMESLVPDLVPVAPRPWSVRFSRDYLKAVIARMNKTDNTAYRWICTLSDAAKAIGPDCFAEALTLVEGAADAAPGANYQSCEIDKFIEIIRMRQTFYEEISA